MAKWLRPGLQGWAKVGTGLRCRSLVLSCFCCQWIVFSSEKGGFALEQGPGQRGDEMGHRVRSKVLGKGQARLFYLVSPASYKHPCTQLCSA